MANWAPLRERLVSVETELTLGWDELDRLVGGLPASAYDHPAFWSGQRPSWAGFSTRDVRVGRSVTFVRRGAPTSSRDAVARPVSTEAAPSGEAADVVLVGCVKRKLDRPAPARDLYTSPLFAKERAYAEASGAPWFVLSAQHGLVAPDTVLEPYDLRLSKTSQDYRRTWGVKVAADLFAAMGDLRGARVEVHAGEAYVGAIREPLSSLGAVVVEPLARLSLGERLAWYGSPAVSAPRSVGAPTVSQLVSLLRDESAAVSPTQLAATGGDGLRSPGLYSWWVDTAGAVDLSAGLGHPVGAGLIYAGLAGATRSKSGKTSSNTLWGRLHSMHLGKRHSFSTFRRSLGSVLTERWGTPEIDEERLTAWMHAHLRVVAVPVADPDTLDAVETSVLAELDPPLNLSKMSPTPLRRRLSELRRRHSS